MGSHRQAFHWDTRAGTAPGSAMIAGSDLNHVNRSFCWDTRIAYIITLLGCEHDIVTTTHDEFQYQQKILQNIYCEMLFLLILVLLPISLVESGSQCLSRTANPSFNF